jgi:triosephosphate isomerase
MHRLIRNGCPHVSREAGQGIRIPYGGSVKPANAGSWSVADVDGALVGGASLKADEFLAIAAACR